MARQNIKFKGLRHSPSDITGQDGDLLECVNLIHDNGELKPIELPERVGIDCEDHILAAVHNMTDGNKFVFVRYDGTDSEIIVKTESNSEIYRHTIKGEEVIWVETIGNTLIFGTDKSIHYALYKNGAYKWLGDKLPQPVFEFEMESNTNEEEGYINVYEPNPPCEYWSVSEHSYVLVPGGGVPFNRSIYSDHLGIYLEYDTAVNKEAIRDNLLAKIAMVTNIAKKKNKFIYPFFIRYAVRMFDGNYAIHSAPILMLPSTNTCPIAAKISNIRDYEDRLDYSGNITVQTKAKSLKLKFVKFVDVNGDDVDVSDWEDIVKGVDLFLSSEVVSFDERYYDLLNNVFVGSYYWHEGTTPAGGDYGDYSRLPEYGNAYCGNEKETWFQNHIDNLTINDTPSAFGYVSCMIPLKSLSKKTIKQKLEDTSLFYRVLRYDLSELKAEDWSGQRKFDKEVEGGTLERLETMPTLNDDYVSRCRMVGNVSYNYNQRLVLGNISLQAPLWYQDAKMFDDMANTMPFVTIYFVIEKPEKTIYVQWSRPAQGSVGLGNYDFGHYLFYPDPDCKRAIIRLYHDGTHTIEVPMHEHTGLHGSYALMPDLQSLWESYADFDTGDYNISPSADRYYNLQNTIAMSFVANPFHFPASNFKDIGRAKVIGIAANMLDVSYEQWGPFPLLAFCSDGIVAITIDKEGKFGGPVDAVSADVLKERRGLSRPTLIQTGQMLVFLTERGMMAIAGTKVQCLSEAMNGRHFNPLTELSPTTPNPSVLYNVGAFRDLITRTSDDVDFRMFAESGFLAYDYAHDRVLLLRLDSDYQYVYSMKTGLWSKEIIYVSPYQIEEYVDSVSERVLPSLDVTPFLASVNNYTEMYLQDKKGRLYKTMQVMNENNLKQQYEYGYFISRPVRFGTDEYKTVTRLLHRFTHHSSMSFVRMAMYGSRDGMNYGRINTLRGMSYQYFIFVVYTYLKPNERYSYMSVDFETRLTNKLR